MHLSSTHIGDYDFEIWQRKNPGISEPFATGLFVRRQGGRWNAFLLDFEDTYSPTIELRKEDTRISIFHDRSRWGHFDGGQQILTREFNGESFPVNGVVIDSDPPGNWWVKQSSQR